MEERQDGQKQVSIFGSRGKGNGMELEALEIGKSSGPDSESAYMDVRSKTGGGTEKIVKKKSLSKKT